MAEQREGMITVRSDLGNYMEEIDQYTAQLPLTIREQMRQALYREYESDYAAQESLCREMLEAAPGNADVLEMLGRCLIAQGRPAEAVPYLTEAHSANPDEQNTAISLGQAYQMLQEYKKAVQVFAEVDPPTEHHPFFYSAYGECLENLGQREKARETFRKEVTHWEETRQIISADILDGCFVRTLYLDALLGAVELTVDLGVYKRFLSKVTMDAKMQKRLAQNISYLSTALPVRTFRIPFRSLIREVEEQGYLLDSEQYFIIENAYRSVESYEYHEDNAVSAMMESFLSAESRAPMAGAVDADSNEKLTALSYEWYMTRYIENHGEEMLYVSEKYPHTYIRAVTFLDQLQTLGAEGMRNAILDKLETFDEIKVPRDALEAGMEEAYQKALRRKKEPVYLTEGSVTYKRTGKKILPNDPCPCGSGKKYKKCHGRK
jgi:tetratricopeptide (TPR) repeat protein